MQRNTRQDRGRGPHHHQRPIHNQGNTRTVSNSRTRPHGEGQSSLQPHHHHRSSAHMNNNNHHYYNNKSHQGNRNSTAHSSNLGASSETIPAARMTPHAAAQNQPAQHSASIVRSGSQASQGGNVLFYSSVQKRGGAFTVSERETVGQLMRKGVIKRPRDTTSLVPLSDQETVKRRYSTLEGKREREDAERARKAVAHEKRNLSRFELPSSDSDADDDE